MIRREVKSYVTKYNIAFLPSGEPLHGFRVCIQAILKDTPTIATENLPKVSVCVWTASLHWCVCDFSSSVLSSGITVQQYVVILPPPFLPLQYLELLRSVQNRPVKCLTIMWALGQAGFEGLSQGLRGNYLMCSWLLLLWAVLVLNGELNRPSVESFNTRTNCSTSTRWIKCCSVCFSVAGHHASCARSEVLVCVCHHLSGSTSPVSLTE